MANIPTFQSIYDRIVNDIEQQYGGSLPRFGKNMLRALAAVKAGSQKLLYLFLSKVMKNTLPTTAEPESVGGLLEVWGRLKIGENPRPPQAAIYQVEVTGNNGYTIPGGTKFKSDDDSANPGQLFQLDSDVTISGTSQIILVRALEAGLVSKLELGDTMTATSPLSGADDTATVQAEDVEPLAGETIDEYRERVELSFRLEPQGGADADYRLWSLDAQGVRLSYPFSVTGEPFFVALYVEAQIANSTGGKGTPSLNMLSNVEDVILNDPDTTLANYKRGRKPITDVVDVQPVTPLDVQIIIDEFVDLDAQLEADIEAAIKSYLRDVRPFVPAIDSLTDRKDTFDINTIIFIVQNVRASVFGDVQLTVGGNVVNSYQFSDGEIPYLDSVQVDSGDII